MKRQHLLCTLCVLFALVMPAAAQPVDGRTVVLVANGAGGGSAAATICVRSPRRKNSRSLSVRSAGAAISRSARPQGSGGAVRRGGADGR